MAVDAPAKIAIVGAGPIGLEAALYARYLGYEVDVFESNVVCGRVLAERDRPLLAPFAKNSSRLGLAALAAHDANYSPPAADAYLTCGEWYDRYLAPLAATDLIADNLRLGVVVRSIGKVEITKCDTPSGEYDRGSWDFRLLTQNQLNQQEAISIADVVLDCSGRMPGRAGHGGLPAVGEATMPRELLAYELVSAAAYRGKSVLVVGDSKCAAQSVVALVHNGAAKVTWATRHEREIGAGPLDVLPDDPLLRRRELLLAANELAKSGKIDWWPGTWLEQLHESNGRAVVQFSGEREETEEFDAIIAQTGYRVDTTLTSELQLDLCPISAAPRSFANWLTQRKSPYSTDYPAPDAAALITSESNYYILGAKSFGCLAGYLPQHGLRQIRDVFTILGDRANLDLYGDR